MKLTRLNYAAMALFAIVYLTSCKPENKNQAKEKFLETAEGKLYYETSGDASNPALLLIHGNGGTSSSMKNQVDYFNDDFFTISADSRSHGKSFDSDTLSYELMAADYISLLDALKIKEAHIIGQSDGGIIGLILAMNYPERITKVVSVAPNITHGTSAIESWELELSRQHLLFIDSMLTIQDRSKDWHREKMHMELMRDKPNIAFSELEKITCPVLVIAGDKDIIRLEHILKIYQHIQNSHLFIMPGATHFMIRQEHELFNQMAHRFLTHPFMRPTSKEVILTIINGKE